MTEATRSVNPDKAMAFAFVKAVTGQDDPLVRVRVLDDKGKEKRARGEEPNASSDDSGTLGKLWPDILAVQEHGLGVFWLPNLCGFEGESFARDTDATGFPALFCDFDKGLPTEWHRQHDIIVHTSEGHGHAYWCIASGASAVEWEHAQRRLIGHYSGADPAIKNTSRLMRLPGTLHMKSSPRLVTFDNHMDPDARAFGLPTITEVLEGVPDAEAAADPKQSAGDVAEDDPRSIAEAERIIGRFKPAIEGQGGDNRTYQLCTRLRRDLNLSTDIALELLTPWNDQCSPPWGVDELRIKLENAGLYGENAVGSGTPKLVAETFKLDLRAAEAQDGTDEVSLVPFSQVQEERMEWLWHGRFAIGKLSLIAGTPGDGKTTIAIDLAARQSNGAELPFGEGKLDQSAAVILSAEDDPGDTLKPRLRAAGANTDYVFYLASEVKRATDSGAEVGMFNFVDDMRRVEQKMVALRTSGIAVKSFIIDPITAFMGGRLKGDSWKNSDVRYILTFLTEFARRQKIAVIGITHLNKSADTRAIYRVLDSIGMVGASRSAWITAKEVDEGGNPTGRTLFALGKTNIAKPPATLAYKIDGVALPALDGGAPIETSRIKWEAISALTADQALSRAGKGNSEESKTSKAAAFLEQVLADGPLDMQEVRRKARKQKQSWRTIERAKSGLGIKSKRTGGVGADGKWEWSLSDAYDDPDFALLHGGQAGAAR